MINGNYVKKIRFLSFFQKETIIFELFFINKRKLTQNVLKLFLVTYRIILYDVILVEHVLNSLILKQKNKICVKQQTFEHFKILYCAQK